MYDKLIQKIDRELHEMESDSVNFKSASAREAVDELSHAMKCLLTCDAMRNAGGSYGPNGGSYGPNGGSYGPNAGSYGMNGGSYGMNGGGYGMNGGGYGMNGGGYGMNSGGYGNGRDGVIRHLADMRSNASTPDERDRIDRWMREMGG